MVATANQLYNVGGVLLERPFKVPFYPLLPLVFCLSCGYMLYSSIDYAALDRKWNGGLVLLGVVPLVLGLILYRISDGMTSFETPMSAFAVMTAVYVLVFVEALRARRAAAA